MNWRLIATGTMFVLGCTLASSNEDIGRAVTVKNEVKGELDSVAKRLSGGMAAAPTTGCHRKCRRDLWRFLDNTQLNIGAASTVVLDRFVFNPSGSARDAAINIFKGAMRSVTDDSKTRNFIMTTPVATIEDIRQALLGSLRTKHSEQFLPIDSNG